MKGIKRQGKESLRDYPVIIFINLDVREAGLE